MAGRRIKTKTPGVYYRELSNGQRQYIIWYTGSDGKPRFENVPGLERDAKKARAKIVDRIAHGHRVAPSKLTVAEWGPRWLEERTDLKPKSVATYESLLKTIVQKLGRHRVSDLDVNHIAGYVAERRQEGRSGATISLELGLLSGMMKTAVRRGLAPVNPVAQLDRSERPKKASARMNILDSNEIKLVLANAGKHHDLLATALFTGLRLGELLALRWEDIDWDEGILHVRDSKTRAGIREVVLMPSVQQLLAKRSLEHPEPFMVGRTTARDWALRPALEKAGVTKHVRFHDLRHTYASILISQGHDVAFICEQLGHANISITHRVYGHLFDRDVRRAEAREKLEAAFGEVLS